MRIIFAGTPDFAVPCLQALIEGPHEVVAVYSQPDRPAGRGRKLTASPVKQKALDNNIPVLQPLSLKTEEAQQALQALNPDLMVVVAYGLILPKAVLDIPRLGCVNVHASLLPRWRGAAPIQRAIQACDAETGVTLMQMDEGLDTGDMLLEINCPIADDETGGSLHDKLADMGASLLAEGVEGLAHDHLCATAQPEEGVTYAHKLSKAEAGIDWSQDAIAIAALIRAFNPWPVAHSKLEKDNIRIWNASASNNSPSGQPGEVLSATAEGIEVACGTGSVIIAELQWPGGKRLTAAQAINSRDMTGKHFE